MLFSYKQVYKVIGSHRKFGQLQVIVCITMTTAARPTFEPARGGKGKGEGGDLSALSKQYSSRDLPAHTKLKYR